MEFKIFLIMIFVFVAAMISLGVWTYNDAKGRGVNAVLWTVVVLLVPNFMGLLIYFLTARKEAVICGNCGKVFSADSNFCPNCGEKIENKNYVKVDKKVNRRFIAIFIVCIAAIFISIVLLAGFYIKDNVDLKHPSSSFSIGMIENNIGDKWNLSFYSFSGKINRTFKLDKAKSKKIIIKSNIKSGSIVLHILQGDKEEKVDLKDDSLEYKLDNFKSGKITLILESKSAKSGKVNIRW